MNRMTENRSFFSLIAALFLLCFATGCDDGSRSTGVPLPKAWPRLPIEMSDSMKAVEGIPVEVFVRSSSEIQLMHGPTPGMTVSYPGTDAKIYFTFIPIETDEQKSFVIKNRRKRIELNLNGVSATTLHSGNGEAVLVSASSGTQTPVQLLGSVPGYVITATSFLDGRDASERYDSLAPLMKVLETDLIRAVPSFRFVK